MIHKIKKYFILLSAVLLFSGTTAIYAAESGRVYDDASLLTSSQAEDLNTQITALETKTGWEIYMITTDDAYGKTTEAYADDFMDEHTAEDVNGVGLLIDMDNREIYISTQADTIRYLTDDRVNAILEDAYSYASDEDYASCFETMLYGVEHCYDKGILSNQYNYDTQTGEISVYHSLTLMEILIVILVAAAAGGIVFAAIIGKYRLKFGTYHYDFHSYGKVNLKNQEDRFINQTVIHHHIQQSNGGNSHSSGRSSTHQSSSGRSHGGGGHKF